MAVSPPLTLQEFCSELDYTDSQGFYFLSDDAEGLPTPLEGVQEKMGVDAVYGRNGSNRSTFKPTIYFKDYEAAGEPGPAELHSRVWNEGKANILITISSNTVKIYNCTKPPVESAEKDIDDSDRLLDSLRLYSNTLEGLEALSEYKRHHVESRRFWSRRHDEFRSDGRVDQHLLKNLRLLKNELDGDLSSGYVNNLIIRSIFILYLEERDIIPCEFFEEEYGYSGYKDILPDKRATYNLYAEIEDRLNGDIFKFTEEEKNSVFETHLEVVERFLEGTDIETGQTRLFPYQFDIIPIELISSIYEKFVGSSGDTGTHYTPPEVVEYMLDEVLEEELTPEQRILDPACGSGTFLVHAFSRIVDRLGKEQLHKDQLKSVLTNQIHGYDINGEAIKISSFSLTFKFLEKLTDLTSQEMDIWGSDFQLPVLINETLHTENYFESELKGGFDVIVGNPPWGEGELSTNSPALSYLEKSNYRIGNNEPAQAFMWKTKDDLANQGEACLAVPLKGVLLNRGENVEKFKESFINSVNLNTVVNLALSRHDLFDEAISPTAIIDFKAHNEQDGGEQVEYVCPKSSDPEVLRDIYVDAEHDTAYISKEQLEEEFVWKTLMWGGISDFELMKKLSRFDTLGTHMDNKDWMMSTGFQDKSTTSRRKHSPELARLPFLDTEDIKPYHISDDSISTYEGGEEFKIPRDIDLYQPPLITMKRTATIRKDGLERSRGPKAVYHDEAVSFRSTVVGISGNEGDEEQLRLLNLLLNSSLVQYWLFMYTTSWGVERPSFRQKELKSIPFPIERFLERSNFFLELDEELKSCIEREGRGERYRSIVDSIDEAIYDVYGLNREDRELIESRVSTTIEYYHKREKSSAVQATDFDHISEYGLSLCNSIAKYLQYSEYQLSPIVFSAPDDNPPLQVLALELIPDSESGTVKKKQGGQDLKDILREIDNKHSKSLFSKRICYILEDDQVYIIKPNERRFWSKAEAINDAPELVGDFLERQRYN